MHRSGTSCLAGSLQQAGVYLGDVKTENWDNPKGNRENKRLMQLQESVLQSNGGSWANPPEEVAWEPGQYSQLCDLLAEYRPHPLWGFKDPRSLFTFSGLEDCIGRMYLVGTFRNPKSVAASLVKRQQDPRWGSEGKGPPYEFWLQLWNQYNKKLISLWEEKQFPIIDFDLDDEGYRKALHEILRYLGLPEKRYRTTILGGLAGLRRDSREERKSEFFVPSLRSEVSRNTDGLPEDVLETYRRLQQIAR
jgi:hypothetical protein